MTERLNKILKSINNNRWGGGRLEVSMMQVFGQEMQFETLVTPRSKLHHRRTGNSYLLQAQTVRQSPDHEILKTIASWMLDKTKEDRGTVQASGNDANDFVDDGTVTF